MPRDNDVEFQPLELVRRLDDHFSEAASIQRSAQEILLIVMRDTDSHALRPKFRRPRCHLALHLRSTLEQAAYECNYHLDCPRVGLQDERARKLDVCPAFVRS